MLKGKQQFFCSETISPCTYANIYTKYLEGMFYFYNCVLLTENMSVVFALR